MSGPSSVQVHEYHRASIFGKRAWRPVQKPLPPLDTKTGQAEGNWTLSVMTYNIWFNNMANDVRYPAIARMLADTGADVVCLQEANQSFLAAVCADRGIKAVYACLGAGGETMKGSFHGCVMLVRKDTLRVRNARFAPLPETRDGRKLLVAELEGVAGTRAAGIHSLPVATAHLESSRSASTARAAQLAYVRETLPAQGSAIFCADTNLCLSKEDSLPEELGFQDAWTDAGNSRDTATANTLYPSRYEPRRIDRILYIGKHVKAQQAALLGDQSLRIATPGGPVDFCLSDHKAVLVILSSLGEVP